MRGRFVSSSVAVSLAISPVIEQLERRRMLDATLVNGIISVTGSDSVDIVIVSVDPLDPQAVLVQLNDATGQSFKLEDSTGIVIDVFGGHDRIGFDPVRG